MTITTTDELWSAVEALSDVCREAGSHLPEEELKVLQVGKAAEEAGEAMHALHGLKGLTTCTDEHSWAEVSNDLVGCVLASMIALVYINGPETREVFDDVFHRRTRRGREATGTATVQVAVGVTLDAEAILAD